MEASFPNIDGYEITSLLGQGGMGSVFLAREKATQRQVAIKVIRRDGNHTGEAEAIARFRREIRVCAAFAHPYVTKIFDGGVQADGSFYLVMEYIEGQSLAESLTEKLLSEQEVINLARQIGEALSYVHAQGIYHRDIKPENIVHLSAERSILVDFGLAFPKDMTRLTETGAVVGSLQTMSPEQLKGKEVTAAADIYSLGATLFYCLTGHYPFEREAIISMAAGVTIGKVPWPANYRQGLSDNICKILQKTLQTNPCERYQSAQELLQALESVSIEKDKPSAIAVDKKPRNSLRYKFAIVFTLLLAFLLPQGWQIYTAHRTARLARQLVQARQQLINEGELPTVELFRHYGSLLVSTGKAKEEPTVDGAAIGLYEFILENLNEKRHKKTAQLTSLFLDRHGLAWFVSGREFPAKELAEASFRAKRSLSLLHTCQRLLKKTEHESKMRLLPLVHMVCKNLTRTARISSGWKNSQIAARKVLPLIEPMLKKVKMKKEEELVAITLFRLYRMDLSEQAREKSLTLLKELMARNGQFLDSTLVIRVGAKATVKSAPDESEVVPTRFRKAVIPFLLQGLNLAKERKYKLDILFLLVQQLNATGAQKEALRQLKKHPIQDDDLSGYKFTYYNSLASVLMTLRRYKEAVKACQQAIDHTDKKSEKEHLKYRLLTIKSLALVENYE